MRVVILADEFFAARERVLLSRLEVGLADEGVRVIHAVPETVASHLPGEVFSTVVSYSTRTLMMSKSLPAKRLVQAIAKVDRAEQPAPVDVVHVFGGASWSLASELASDLGAALAVEIWRSGLISRARGLKAEIPPVLFAPDPTIEKALLAESPGASVRLCKWGVHVPSTERAVLKPGRAVAVMIVGTGRNTRAFVSAIEGLAAMIREDADLHIFCDALAARRSGVWATARRLGILERVSLIEELEGRRDMLLHGDILVLPEALGEQRSIALDAMGHGMIVVAAADPMVSALIDGRTARLVSQPETGEWASVLRTVIGQRDASRDLAARAIEFVRQERRATDHIRSVLSAYEWMTREAAIPFEPPTSGG